MARDRKDDRFERIIGPGLAAGHSDRDAKHPDASTIAAYRGGSLARDQRAQCDRHFAQCARCTSALAALVRLDEIDDASASAAHPQAAHGEGRRWWRRRGLRPLAAFGAAAAIVFVVVLKAITAQRVPFGGEAPARLQAKSLERAARAREPEMAAVEKSASAPPPPAVATAPAPASASPAESSAARAGAATLLGAGTGSIGGASGANRPAPAQMAATTAGAATAGAGVIVVEPPDHSVVWMVGALGAISRYSTATGWTAQTSGVTADLTGGSAPSATICWIVGRTGTILRTVDGEHWTRVVAPVSDDLAAVSALSAAAATIATISGRRFATSDGGATWRPLP